MVLLCVRMPRAILIPLAILVLIPIASVRQSLAGSVPGKTSYTSDEPFCIAHPGLCADSPVYTYEGKYVGHDEPEVIFYSNVPGSGYDQTWTITLPKDSRTKPRQDGSGGTWNFQLHPAFWFGVAVCDTQSYPEFSSTCVPDSDANIFDNSNPSASDYAGKHPGVAFVEMQFYPPGWVTWDQGGTSCDATHWCAALNVDSLNVDPNHDAGNGKTDNNMDCQQSVGLEPVNFAFITRNGVADSAGDPLNNAHFIPNLKNDLLMNPGDRIQVHMFDTAQGLRVVLNDLTSKKVGQGSMAASIENGFAQVVFAPNAQSCTSQPYAFHPMYATSTPHTRNLWGAHSQNVAFSDEVGHFEYCASVDSHGLCVSGGDDGQTLVDDGICFDAVQSSRIKIGGCTSNDTNFDGPTYQLVWPGTGSNPKLDLRMHSAPVRFTSPLFHPAAGGSLMNFSSVAFETDLPDLEHAFGFSCSTATGDGCTNPPGSAAFYPFYSAGTDPKTKACVWQLGGANIRGTTNVFGGTPDAAYGSPYPLFYPDPSGGHTSFNDFQNALGSNPCLASP